MVCVDRSLANRSSELTFYCQLSIDETHCLLGGLTLNDTSRDAYKKKRVLVHHGNKKTLLSLTARMVMRNTGKEGD